ncbi:hypothetical protein HSBAA_49350 [Vreelandella sulfidaeris]|uniref:Small ribosomal subunit protein bS21 n=1 Tax=Vreelandella sulfidaeris TaxID=115553 RepID=A0A455UHE0_9GAMM|nr:hypothetical protein HSBAA_49350 [Halomonas sulfidaeris]
MTSPCVASSVLAKKPVFSEVRRREHYEKPTAERKRKAAAAVKRHAKKVQREQKRFERLY